MIISRETDYSIRILKCLSDGYVHVISEVCDSAHVPRQIGHKIIEKLQDAGMVTCKKGKGGGCSLVSDLKGLTLYEVMVAVENECDINLCMSPGHICPWRETHLDTSKIHPKLGEIENELNDRLKSMDLYSVMFGE